MHSRTNELLAFLDEHRAAFRAALDAVPAERRGRRPSPEEWSVADVLTHVVVVDKRIAGLFAKSIDDARQRGVGTESNTSAILPTLNVGRFVDRTTKITGPKQLNPMVSGDSFGWSDFEVADEALKAALVQGDGMALGEISAPHPFFGMLDMYEWVAMVGGHRSRHAEQIREIDATARG